MDISDAYARFCGNFEGLGSNVDPVHGLVYPYKDVAGILTIGYGHQIPPKEAPLYFNGLSLRDASNLYDSDLPKFLRTVKALTMAEVYNLLRQDEKDTVNDVRTRLASWKVTVNQYQFDCLCDLAFNGGPGQLDGHIKQYLIAKDYDSAGCFLAEFCKAFSKKYKKLGPITGLTWRRYTMVRYWFTGVLDQVTSWNEAHVVESLIKKLFATKGKVSPLPYYSNLQTSQLE